MINYNPNQHPPIYHHYIPSMSSVMLAMAPPSDIMAPGAKMSSPLSIWRLVAVNAVVAGWLNSILF